MRPQIKTTLTLAIMGLFSTSFSAVATTDSDSKGQLFPEHVYWGDQHVHSAWSADGALAGATLTPEDAVRFARGEEVISNTGQKAKLHRAFDWIAVTDHSDGMGTIDQLNIGNPEMMADPTAKRWYDMMQKGGEEGLNAKKEAVKAQATKTLPNVFMDPKWMKSAWEKNVDIMEKYNEPGKFTAFIAYEWTSNGEDGNNLHRNVIFRENADKTKAFLPLTTFFSADPNVSGTDPESLWAWLNNWEEKTGGQVLAIPHNGNMSNGQMFDTKRYNGSPLTKKWVEDRARWEVLYEIFQFKGAGEAHPSLSPNDEFANFGIWDTANLDGVPKKEEQLKTEYLRTALKNGLLLQKEFGTNPFKFGMVAGTDTHTALAAQEEDNFFGKFASNEPKANRWNQVYKKEGSYTRRDWTLLAAGITGLWAEENTRASLWDALKRRETYASSGPRIQLRFFAGFDLTATDATADNLVKAGYSKGVPMGGDLKPLNEEKNGQNKAPTFLLSALKDPIGGNLDQIQIIKGWLDKEGVTHEKIFVVDWGQKESRPMVDGKVPPVGNTVDVMSATYTNTIGTTQFVTSFTDPEFDPEQHAFYYARVIEIPTPRWTNYDAVKFNVKMDEDVLMFHQERVVSSPIWYDPN